MSYRCQECNKLHNDKELKITKKIRDVVYQHLIEKRSRNPEDKPTYFLHNESNGQEIVTSLKVCSACYETFKENEPQVGEKKIVKVIVSQKDAKRIKFKKNNNRDENKSRKFKKDTKSSVSYDRSGSFKSFRDL